MTPETQSVHSREVDREFKIKDGITREDLINRERAFKEKYQIPLNAKIKELPQEAVDGYRRRHKGDIEEDDPITLEMLITDETEELKNIYAVDTSLIPVPLYYCEVTHDLREPPSLELTEEEKKLNPNMKKRFDPTICHECSRAMFENAKKNGHQNGSEENDLSGSTQPFE